MHLTVPHSRSRIFSNSAHPVQVYATKVSRLGGVLVRAGELAAEVQRYRTHIIQSRACATTRLAFSVLRGVVVCLCGVVWCDVCVCRRA